MVFFKILRDRMPELPEVETVVLELKESDLIGDRLLSIALSWPKTFQGTNKVKFNETIQDISRRGKWIVFSMEHFKLLFHLRMTGKLKLALLDEPVHKHERARLFLKSNRVLIFEDQRKFGRIIYSEKDDPLEELGLEPFEKEFQTKKLADLFSKSHRNIKAFLLDQTKIAGLGNIYVDEALFNSKIHPLTLASNLSTKQIESLRKSILLVLQRGIENRGTTLGTHRSNYSTSQGKRGSNQTKLLIFRKEGQPCLNCGEKIIKIKAAGRGTHLCPHCQKEQNG